MTFAKPDKRLILDAVLLDMPKASTMPTFADGRDYKAVDEGGNVFVIQNQKFVRTNPNGSRTIIRYKSRLEYTYAQAVDAAANVDVTRARGGRGGRASDYL